MRAEKTESKNLEITKDVNAAADALVLSKSGEIIESKESTTLDVSRDEYRDIEVVQGYPELYSKPSSNTPQMFNGNGQNNMNGNGLKNGINSGEGNTMIVGGNLNVAIGTSGKDVEAGSSAEGMANVMKILEAYTAAMNAKNGK